METDTGQNEYEIADKPLKFEPGSFQNEIIIKKLPKDIVVGSEISFTDTLLSNPDEFTAFYSFKIAKKFNLDPETDYQKIKDLSNDKEIIEEIKNELLESANKRYIVTEMIIPGERTYAVDIDMNPEDEARFFERFDYLQNSGAFQVSEEQLQDVEELYIGGGIGTSAYDNLESIGVYGATVGAPTYFSTDYEVALSHMNTDVEKPILIVLSTDKLDKSGIYQDPESLNVAAEAGKTFIKFHGVKTDAIKRILVLKKV